MIMSSPLPRLRQLCSGFTGSDQFTTREVRALLDPRAKVSPRREAVLAVAAVPSAWADHLRDRDLELLGRSAGQLPSILFWHRAGLSLEEIGRRITFLSGAWRASLALEVSARCIAEQLNRYSGPAMQRGAVAATAGTLAPPPERTDRPERTGRQDGPPKEPRRSWWHRLADLIESFDRLLKVAAQIERVPPSRQTEAARDWLEGRPPSDNRR
jgi:hypothetical protein